VIRLRDENVPGRQVAVDHLLRLEVLHAFASVAANRNTDIRQRIKVHTD
jgi:hypothetical protein